METLILLGSLLCAVAAGFFVMSRLDRFFARGGFSPDPDSTEEAASGSRSQPPNSGVK